MAFDRSLTSGFTAFALIIGSSSLVLAEGVRGNLENRSNRCSAYGPEFVAIEGTDSCARIGGHIRVEIGAGNGLRNGFSGSGSDGARPAALNSRQSDTDTRYDDARGHLRVRELPGSRDLFAR
jgi:hypothetical protein